MTEQALSFFSFILPTWTINSAITTFNSCWKDHYLFFFFKHLTGSSSVGPGELSLKDWAWCFKWFCLFWGEQVCDSKAHQQDWWFVCLVLFLLRGPVWFSLSVLKSYTLCTQRGGRTPPGLPALSSTEMPRWRIIPVWWAAFFFFSPAKQMGFTFRFKWDKQDDYKILYCAVIIFIFYTWLQIRSLVPVLAVEGKFKKRSFKHFISHNSGVRLFKSTTTKPPYAVRKQHAFPRLSESYCIILYLHRCGNRQ